MRERTVDRARGRWREILPVLGINVGFLNGKHQPCPVCGGRDRARFDDRRHDGDYFCSQCGAGTGITLLMKVNGWDYATAAKRVDEIIGTVPVVYYEEKSTNHLPDNRKLRQLWKQSYRVTTGDPVAQYLAARGIVDKPIPSCLRYIPRMRYQKSDPASFHPGMIALFTGSDGKPATLHRTYLTSNGRKAPLDPVRLFMPGKIAVGGAVRLDTFSDKLGIAEGIETALSVSTIHDVPCWATLTEGLMRAWEPPPQVKYVVVFGDNDEKFVGQAAAYELAVKLAKRKDLFVEVRIPKLVGHDWNDTLREAMR